MIEPSNTKAQADQLQFISLSRAALVIGHPGHELLVHRWLELARPMVFVLTDGSGRTNQSRLNSTSEILNQTGAKQGSIYGRLTDRAAYSAMLNHEFDLFVQLAGELAAALTSARIDYVVGDAREGYSPTHDVCRLVINAALEVANRMSGQRVGNFEFVLRSPQVDHESRHPGDIHLTLDQEAFARKLARAKAYAGLSAEVSAALGRTPVDAFRTEHLRRVSLNHEVHSEGRPFYEQYGEKRVAEGHYKRVIRYREHLAPLAEALAVATVR